MKINCTDLKQVINSMDSLIEKYQNNYANLNNCFNEVSNYWNDNIFLSFSEKIDDERKKILKSIIELKQLKQLYQYVAREYSNFGYDIVCDLNKRGIIFDYFNNYFDVLNNIINSYNSIPMKYFDLIRDQRDYFVNLEKNLEIIYKYLDVMYDRIKNIEDQVSLRFSKINIEYINVSDTEKLL